MAMYAAQLSERAEIRFESLSAIKLFERTMVGHLQKDLSLKKKTKIPNSMVLENNGPKHCNNTTVNSGIVHKCCRILQYIFLIAGRIEGDWRSDSANASKALGQEDIPIQEGCSNTSLILSTCSTAFPNQLVFGIVEDNYSLLKSLVHDGM